MQAICQKVGAKCQISGVIVTLLAYICTIKLLNKDMNLKMMYFGLLLLSASSVMAQPCYDLTNMSVEQPNRGVVAVRNGQQVVVSWRTLMTDQKSESFDVFRNG